MSEPTVNPSKGATSRYVHRPVADELWAQLAGANRAECVSVVASGSLRDDSLAPGSSVHCVPAPGPTPVLSVAMIEPTFRALLVPGVGPPPLLEASLLAASGTAVAMAAVAVRTDEKTPRDTLCPRKLVAGEPLRCEPPPCAFAGGARQQQRLRDRLEPARFGRPDEGRRTRNPVALTAGFLFPSAFHDTIVRFTGLLDDRTDDCAFGADEVAPVGPKLRKLRFQMIADMHVSADVKYPQHCRLLSLGKPLGVSARHTNAAARDVCERGASGNCAMTDIPSHQGTPAAWMMITLCVWFPSQSRSQRGSLQPSTTGSLRQSAVGSGRSHGRRASIQHRDEAAVLHRLGSPERFAPWSTGHGAWALRCSGRRHAVGLPFQDTSSGQRGWYRPPVR